MENVWDEIQKAQLKLLGNVKLTQKAKLLTRYCLLLQPYLIFKPLSILYGFPDRLFYFFTVYFTMAVIISLAITVVINRYRTPASKKFQQLFFSFRKVWGYPTSPIL